MNQTLSNNASKKSTLLGLYGHIKTAEQRTIIQQYDDCHTGR